MIILSTYLKKSKRFINLCVKVITVHKIVNPFLNQIGQRIQLLKTLARLRDRLRLC